VQLEVIRSTAEKAGAKRKAEEAKRKAEEEEEQRRFDLLTGFYTYKHGLDYQNPRG
jgi:conjugal transfer/entry exclusion protein